MEPFIQRLGVLSATLSIFLSASAYDFEVDSIYYNFTDSVAKEVEVTYNSPGSYSGAIVVPSSVTYKGESYKVTAIGTEAFEFCSGLTSITLPNAVTSIGQRSFSGCHALTSITLPGTVTTIGEYAFYMCESMTKIDVDVENQVYSSKDGILYNKSQETLVRCPEGKAGEVIIPNSVTTIGEGAFADCGSLTSIVIPNSVTTIGNSAFNGCSGLTTIEIPNSVTAIGGYTFTFCSSLTTIEIPNTVTTIGDYTFADCSSLTTIEIPNSVTTIGECSFFGCSSLITIEIPNSVTTIGKATFSECLGLTTMEIPNSVTTIGDDAFNTCLGLISVTIPNSVTTIGYYAFIGCSSLRSITSLAVTPPECGDRVFDKIDKQKCTLYVPAGSIEAYKQAPKWKDFNIVAEAGTGIDSIEAGPAAGITEVFNLAGEKVAATPENLPAGIYIVREGLTARKIVVR